MSLKNIGGGEVEQHSRACRAFKYSSSPLVRLDNALFEWWLLASAYECLVASANGAPDAIFSPCPFPARDRQL